MKKRLVLAASILSLCVGVAFASDPVYLSSNTITAETTARLCGTAASPKRSVFHGVRVHRADGAGFISLFNSNGTATQPFAVITATTTVLYGGIDYNVALSSGLTYTTTAAGNNVTFLYTCY